ncbi:MAG: ornithine carbamoyltransferase [Phycisphaerales bacterium]|jgi:ornithine carbamoyltransferase|nr:ornithine carbamoyltransferase [Phycisphaerales bacterium]
MTTIAGLHAPRSKDLLRITDLSRDEVGALFTTARSLRADRNAFAGALTGRAIILLFEKASLRTRVTFEVGPARLGAHAMYFEHTAQRIGQRESIKDYARNLERWVDAIVARVYAQSTLDGLAANCDVPVVNALSDAEHPCQALADLFTLENHLAAKGRSLTGAHVAYVGDGNNVCNSLMLLCAMLGVHFTFVGPAAHAPRPEFASRAGDLASSTGSRVHVSSSLDALASVDAVYTDTWVSMGDEAQAAAKQRALSAYQVNARAMSIAGPNAVFMHCLPAHRGEEVTDGVIDSPASIVYEQAESRMHVQNALLLHMLRGE